MNKDKINKIALFSSIILGGVFLIAFFGEFSFELESQLFLYPLAITFFVWFVTRKNGCGSCNQVN